MKSSQFPGFPKEGMTFLRNLAKNNDREWFQPRKAIYEEKVRQPMLELTAAVHQEMMRFAPAFVGDPAKCIFRIYRDTRFSKDKTPYKTHIAASLKHSSLGKDSGQFGMLAGYYFSISPKEIGVGGGLYMPPPDVLLAARTFIADHYKEFRATYSGAKVKRLLGELGGDSLTRVPKGFDPEHPAADVLKKKYWMLYTELDPALATSPKLLKEIADRLAAIAPLVDFLNRPLLAQGKKRVREERFFA
jgi:uncharacterized protein (TIGR02453 family)